MLVSNPSAAGRRTRAAAFAAAVAAATPAFGQFVDFTTFTPAQGIQTTFADPVWETPTAFNDIAVTAGDVAVERENSDASFFYGPSSLETLNKTISGDIYFGTDDDYVGIALGLDAGAGNNPLLNPAADYLLLQWKGADQDFNPVTARLAIHFGHLLGQLFDEIRINGHRRILHLERGAGRKLRFGAGFEREQNRVVLDRGAGHQVIFDVGVERRDRNLTRTMHALGQKHDQGQRQDQEHHPTDQSARRTAHVGRHGPLGFLRRLVSSVGFRHQQASLAINDTNLARGAAGARINCSLDPSFIPSRIPSSRRFVRPSGPIPGPRCPW